MAEPPASVPQGPRNWDGFLKFVEERNGEAGVKVGMLHLTQGEHSGNELVVTCKSQMLCSQLTEKQTLANLDTLTKEFFGPAVEVRVETGDIPMPKTNKQLMEEAEQHPGVNKVMEAFSAQLISVSHRKH